MTSWETITGIGYMFQSPVQAFFLNNIGGFMSVIVLALVVFDLLKSKVKSTYINIPLLLSAIFISLPMVVFQQAKDMKLDSALYFISVIALYILYVVVKKGIFEKKIDDTSIYKYLFVVGIIA